MVIEWSELSILFFISLIIGFINTLAGSGSLVMLPLFIGMGLDPNVANGTNRVAIFFSSLIGLYSFIKSKQVKITKIYRPLIFCLPGALLGAYLASIANPFFIKRFIGAIMLVMFPILLIKPSQWIKGNNEKESKEKTWISSLTIFLIGIYGGFIQASVGIFMLIAFVVVMRFNLKTANTFKLILIVSYTFPALLIFHFKQQINWEFGLLTTIGQGLGAYMGGLFATRYKQADIWVYRLLIAVIIAAILYHYKILDWLL